MNTTVKHTRYRMAFIGAVMLLVAIPATAIGYRLAVADRSIGGGASPAVIDAERTVLIDGEKIAVTDVVYRADEDMLDIVVVNQERLDRASVLFVAMDEGTVTIRGCYALPSTSSVMTRPSIRTEKATRCKPATVSGKRS